MVELNHRQRTIKIKIVYYGPPLGGKTTNIQVLHENAAAERRGEMVSINSAQDRTILFDLLPIRAAGFRGFDLRLQVLAVPGQAMYAATRRLVLKGADSLVFVANSAADRWEENVASFREMTQNLLAHQLDPASLPLVLQYNKRDLPEVTPIPFMDRTLNARKVHAVSAVAVRGEGVLETFASILTATMQDLVARYQIIDVAKGQPLAQWVKQTMLGVFGKLSLAPEPPPPAPPVPLPAAEVAAPAPLATEPEPPVAPRPPRTEEELAPGRRTVRISLPEDAVRLASSGPSARANETLVESYAQASSALSADLAEMREERDQARRLLDDVQAVLRAGEDLIQGQPPDAVLRRVVNAVAEAGGASHGSILLTAAGRSFRLGAARGFTEDPLLKLRGGVRHVLERFLSEQEPRVHLAADSLDLGEALSAVDPPFAALASAPIRTPRGLQGLALLYYGPDDVVARPETLTHLGFMALGLAAPLELMATRDATREAEKVRQTALVGTAAVRAVQEVLTSILALRDRIGALRQHPDIPGPLLPEFGTLAPCLADALSTARALLTLNRGEAQKENVDIGELVAGLDAGGLQVDVERAIPAVLGDPALLRLGILTLIEYLRELGGSGPLLVQARSEGGLVKLRLARDAAPTPEVSPSSDLRLALAQRIAEINSGRLLVESEAGRSFFTLTLLPA
ncbi:MAG TPA: hypothetical protein VJU18_02395 [Vicinamibacteria bacterium]|nr:hypothetical protein [Vicinamibacteria bacterium]